MFGAFLFVLERWHFPHFRKWHSHLQKGLSWLTPYSFDVAFHSVIQCPITICIFTFHVVNLHSNHWLYKYSWVGYIHLSDWSSSWAQTRIFFSSPQNLFGLQAYGGQMLCQPNGDVCVCCMCLCWHKSLKKKRKRGRMKINYSNYPYAMHSGSDFSKFPTILTMPGSHHQCEWNTHKNSTKLIFFQLTGQKKKPVPLW